MIQREFESSAAVPETRGPRWEFVDHGERRRAAVELAVEDRQVDRFTVAHAHGEAVGGQGGRVGQRSRSDGHLALPLAPQRGGAPLVPAFISRADSSIALSRARPMIRRMASSMRGPFGTDGIALDQLAVLLFALS